MFRNWPEPTARVAEDEGGSRQDPPEQEALPVELELPRCACKKLEVDVLPKGMPMADTQPVGTPVGTLERGEPSPALGAWTVVGVVGSVRRVCPLVVARGQAGPPFVGWCPVHGQWGCRW